MSTIKKYKTIQGDTWDLIAYRLYESQGGEKRTGDLLDANPEYKDYVKFPAGIILEVPEVNNAAIETLPPWKR